MGTKYKIGGLVILFIILLLVIYYGIVVPSSNGMVNYGREEGSLYLPWPYNPVPDWTAVDRNYGYICTLGGRCELVRGGLLTKEECSQCTTEKIHWTPPWKAIV